MSFYLSDVLEKDEIVLWQKTNKAWKKALKINLLIITISSFIIILPLSYYLISLILAITIFIEIIWLFISRRPINAADKRKRERFLMSILNLNRRNLRKFRELYVLTNKRWIQREIEIEFYKYASKFPDKTLIGKYGVSINLAHVKVWSIGKSIRLYVDAEEYKKGVESKFGISFKNSTLSKIVSELPNLSYRRTEEGQDLYYQKGTDIDQYEISKSKEKSDIKSLGINLFKYKKDLKNRTTVVGYQKKINLPIIENPNELASFLNLEYSTLKNYCIIKNELSSHEFLYRRFSIKKKSGGNRIILAPKKTLKTIQEKIYDNILKKIAPSDFAHGFRVNRSTVSNAKEHFHAEIIYNLDLKNFFPSIEFNKVLNVFKNAGYSGLISSLLATLCTVPYRFYVPNNMWILKMKENNLPQGAPTSPTLANLVCIYLDNELNWISKKYGFKYTRYADDLTFSSPTAVKIEEEFSYQVLKCIEKHGFKVNEKKANVSANNVKARNFKYRRVTGIIVHDDYLSLPRLWIRKLRAAIYELKSINIDRNDPYLKDLIKNIEGRCSYATMVNKDRYSRFYEDFKRLKNEKIK